MPDTTIFTDQLQDRIAVPFPPQRIVSLVPSQTELLHYLDLGKRVVGITKFCEHPEDWFRNKSRVGGTKQVHFDKIAALAPDLIIGNKEENERSQIETLRQQYPVWMSDIHHLEEALEMIRRVGALVDRSAKAEALSQAIAKAFADLAQQMAHRPTSSAAYLIWRKPYMAAARNAFIDDLLQRAGFHNAFAELERYPEISAAALQEKAPDYILLSSEPYPFREKHLAELQSLCPKSVIKLVDGTLFSWYGNRLLLAAPYFLNLQQ